MAGIEQVGACIPEGKVAEAGFKHEEIFAYTARLLSLAWSEKHGEPPPRMHPKSFDEIYSMRDQLAAFNVSLGRSAAEQEAYYAFIKTINNPDQLILDKYFAGNVQPGDRRLVISPNEYPATMPPDAEHLLLWYVNNDLPNSLVANRISDYILSKKLTTKDFVVYRKPPNSGNFIPGFSRSISLPHVHLILRRDIY